VRRAALLLFGLSAAGGPVAASASGCGTKEVPEEPNEDASAPDVREASTPPDVGLPDTSVPEPTPPRPAFVPQGWELWTDFKKAAQIYLPTRKDVLPPPAVWEPCDAAFFPDNPGGKACEQWAMVEPGQTGAGTMSSFSEHSPGVGRFVLPQMRMFDNHLTWVVVDVATGEPQNALMSASPAWVANPTWPSATGTLYRVAQYGDPGPVEGYLIAPHDPTLPRFSGAHTTASGTSLTLAGTLLGQTVVGAVFQGPWSNPRAQRLAADPVLQPLLRFYRGDTAYLDTTGGNRHVHQVARPGAPLETWFDNAQNPYAYETSLAVDETDVTWVRHEGCTTTSARSCTAHDVYVAKVPPPGSRPVGRRLRSSGLLFPDTTLGCSYIASAGEYADYLSELWVTRVSDGVSFRRRQMAGSNENGYTSPVAVTCEHVYVVRSPRRADQLPNLVRIRLDALGAPIPPD
jgi:hypothetical protein